jgi:hypothetical protein
MNYEGVSFQGRICGVSIMRGKLLGVVNAHKLTFIAGEVGHMIWKVALETDDIGYGSWFEGLLSLR